MARSCLLLCLAFAIAALLGPGAEAGARPGSGDADCSGATNSIDALFVLQVEADLKTLDALPCIEAANVHIDSTLDSRDATPILQFEAHLLESLPPIPSSILDIVLEAASEEFDVSPDMLTVAYKETAGWPDSCLGVYHPDEGCLPTIQFGWRVTVAAPDGRAGIWHINSTGQWRRAE